MSKWCALLVFLPWYAFAQVTSESAVEHMDYLSQHDETLSKKYLSYMSEVAHGHKARKMEKRREDVVSSIKEAIRDCAKLRPYKGDASLRDAQKQYYSILLSVFLEDYGKIVNLEEVAERSYDAMEAYLLTEQKAREKLDEASQSLRTSYQAFASKNNVKLTPSQETKLDRKMARLARVNNYMNKVYLVFFKSSIQENLMMEALNKKDINGVEQCKSSMLKFSTEGLAKLDTLRPFNNDGSLINACRRVLEFQKSEAENKMNVYSEFLMKEEEFEKIKRSFDSKKSGKTQAEVESYNNAVNNFNATINNYNKVNDDLNSARTKVMDQWENTRKRFLEQHVPKA